MFNKPAAPTPAPAQPSKNEVQTQPDVVESKQAPAEPKEPVNPLDAYKELFTDSAEGASTKDTNKPASLDQNKLMDVISKADFTNTIDQETLSTIQAGGEEATSAFKTALNKSSQQVLFQSTLAVDKMVSSRLDAALKQHKAEIPEMLREQSAKDGLMGKNPVFNNPAVKPVVDLVQAAFSTKNPGATSTELQGMTEKFITALGEAFNPTNSDGDKEQQQTNNSSIEGSDFSKWLDDNNQLLDVIH